MWVTYALLTAFMLATSDTLTKKVLASRDAYLVAWIRLLFALPLFILSLLIVEIPQLDRTFWIATLIALPLEITAYILYTKALQASPLSLTIPFLALTPLFLIFISYIILGERSVYSGERESSCLPPAATCSTSILHGGRSLIRSGRYSESQAPL